MTCDYECNFDMEQKVKEYEKMFSFVEFSLVKPNSFFRIL